MLSSLLDFPPWECPCSFPISHFSSPRTQTHIIGALDNAKYCLIIHTQQGPDSLPSETIPPILGRDPEPTVWGVFICFHLSPLIACPASILRDLDFDSVCPHFGTCKAEKYRIVRFSLCEWDFCVVSVWNSMGFLLLVAVYDGKIVDPLWVPGKLKFLCYFHSTRSMRVGVFLLELWL